MRHHLSEYSSCRRWRAHSRLASYHHHRTYRASSRCYFDYYQNSFLEALLDRWYFFPSPIACCQLCNTYLLDVGPCRIRRGMRLAGCSMCCKDLRNSLRQGSYSCALYDMIYSSNSIATAWRQSSKRTPELRIIDNRLVRELPRISCPRTAIPAYTCICFAEIRATIERSIKAPPYDAGWKNVSSTASFLVCIYGEISLK